MQSFPFLEIKSQNSEIQHFFNEIGILNSGICPRCSAIRGKGVTKDGLYNSVQIFYCKLCKIKFRETTGTCFFKCIFKPQMFFAILCYFVENLTAKQTASMIHNHFSDDYKISYRSIQKLYKLYRSLIHAFILRYICEVTLNGEIEIDEAHIYIKKDLRGRPALSV